MNDNVSNPWAAGSSGVAPIDELPPAPNDVLDAPLRELRQLGRLQPPRPSPELDQLLLTGLPPVRFGRTRRRTILVSGALAVTVATGVTGMAAAHDSPRTGAPVQTTSTSPFDPAYPHQRGSVAPSPVVPARAPATPVEPEDDPTPSGREMAPTSSSPPVAQPSAPSRSAMPRHESETPDDRTRLTSPTPRPSTSFTRRDE